MIGLLFTCGHVLVIQSSNPPTNPRCEQCGEARVARVTAARPTFRGAVSGPCAAEK